MPVADGGGVGEAPQGSRTVTASGSGGVREPGVMSTVGRSDLAALYLLGKRSGSVEPDGPCAS